MAKHTINAIRSYGDFPNNIYSALTCAPAPPYKILVILSKIRQIPMDTIKVGIFKILYAIPTMVLKIREITIASTISPNIPRSRFIARFPASIEANTNLAPIEKSQFPAFILNSTPQPKTAGANPCLNKEIIAFTDRVSGETISSKIIIIIGIVTDNA